jgi:hypothetical protein
VTRWPWRRWRALHTTPARLGLTGLLPVRPAGGPAFGAIAGRGGGLTALLTLPGRRLWLDEPAALTAALARVTAALAGPPVQLVLRRRRADLAGSLAGWRTLVQAGVPDPARQAALERDYVGLALPRLRDGGLATVAAALAISAATPAQLGRRVARLQALLPGGAHPLDLRELAEWLADWCGAGDRPPALRPDEPAGPEALAPARLDFADDHLRLADERAVWFWHATALPPLVELGWVRHLLAEPALAGLEWDLSLHCRPVLDQAAERRATARALRRVELRLARWRQLGRAPQRGGIQALLGEREELAQRLTALAAPGRQLRQVVVWLAVRGEARQAEAAAPLAAALARLGFALAPVRGRLAVERAWRAVGPLNEPPAGSEAAAALLPAAAVAPLAWWAVAPGQPPAGWPVVTTTVERTASAWPALPADAEHLLATGDDTGEQRAALQAWALTLALTGAQVVALHTGNDWSRLAEATGGPVGWLGPDGDFGLDPVAAAGYNLHQRADWLGWLEECAAWLARLLPETDPAGHDDLRAALVALGLGWLESGRPLSLWRLRDHLEAGGYDALRAALDGALSGRWRWLGQPALALDDAPGLTALGWAGADAHEWPFVAAAVARWLQRRQMARPAARRRPTVLVVDDGAPLLRDPVAAAALVALARHGRPARLRLWLAAGPSTGLARTLAGRLLLVNAGNRAAFREAAAPVDELIDVHGWPPAAARLVPELPAGVALLRTAGDTAIVRVAIDAVIAAARSRAIGRRWPAAAIATA